MNHVESSQPLPCRNPLPLLRARNAFAFGDLGTSVRNLRIVRSDPDLPRSAYLLEEMQATTLPRTDERNGTTPLPPLIERGGELMRSFLCKRCLKQCHSKQPNARYCSWKCANREAYLRALGRRAGEAGTPATSAALSGGRSFRPLPDSHTKHPPGSPQRIAALQRRAAAGVQLFHPLDATMDDSPHSYGRKRFDRQHGDFFPMYCDRSPAVGIFAADESNKGNVEDPRPPADTAGNGLHWHSENIGEGS
jgi:hypothetical protein